MSDLKVNLDAQSIPENQVSEGFDLTKLKSADPIAVAEALGLLQRLASLFRRGELGELVEAPLDGMLTAKQAGQWLQCSPKGLNEDAKHNRIPAIPRGNEWRFHPRTIL